MDYVNCEQYKIVKEIKKVLPKDGIFQISEHKSPMSIGQCVTKGWII